MNVVFDKLQELCDMFGIPYSFDKIKPGVTEIVFLGLLLCTLTQCLNMSADKLAEVTVKINTMLSHKNSKVTLRELQSFTAFSGEVLVKG